MTDQAVSPPSTASAAGRTPRRILVVGGGGRENALGWALARCPGVEAVWVSPGNGGTAALEGCRQLAVAEGDAAGLLEACRTHAIELVVVGPEAPLAAGLADRLRAGDWRCSDPARRGPCWRPASAGPRN